MTETSRILKALSKPAIKICGVSDNATIDAAVDCGAAYIGFVNFEKSPRHVTLNQAAELREYAAGRIKTVLLTVNKSLDETSRALNIVQPDIIQLHGSETPEWLRLVRQNTMVELWKALGVKDTGTLEESRQFSGVADKLLFDAPAQNLPGGSGNCFDWSLVGAFNHTIAWGLAGGLTPENVGEAIDATGAPLVDVSSGVESAPGLKDVAKIAAFCQAVRDYDTRTTESEQLP
ncbi:MAG: phosphoribosylanthranilate isomerase [Sphingomonadales bacterium]|nr:phosphoribosylanthranilate isomerase [Sphingomonadales bacterium]